MSRADAQIAEIQVADDGDAWSAAGFDVGPDGVCRIGGVGIRLVGRARGTGIVGWSLRGLSPGNAHDVDGIPTTSAVGPPEPAGAHPNGVIGIDHLVLASPDLARTVESLATIDVPVRRQRDVDLGGRPMRQLFFRMGEVIVEAVGSPTATGTDPSTLWGLTYTVVDIDAAAVFFGDPTTRVKDAVQPGRRITTLRHEEFGMSVRTALISPTPDRASR